MIFLDISRRVGVNDLINIFLRYNFLSLFLPRRFHRNAKLGNKHPELRIHVIQSDG